MGAFQRSLYFLNVQESENLSRDAWEIGRRLHGVLCMQPLDPTTFGVNRQEPQHSGRLTFLCVALLIL